MNEPSRRPVERPSTGEFILRCVAWQPYKTFGTWVGRRSFPPQHEAPRARTTIRLRNRTVVVSSADAFIGSPLLESLLAAGAQVQALVCYSSVNTWGWLDTLAREKLDRIAVVSGDIHNAQNLQEPMLYRRA